MWGSWSLWCEESGVAHSRYLCSPRWWSLWRSGLACQYSEWTANFKPHNLSWQFIVLILEGSSSKARYCLSLSRFFFCYSCSRMRTYHLICFSPDNKFQFSGPCRSSGTHASCEFIRFAMTLQPTNHLRVVWFHMLHELVLLLAPPLVLPNVSVQWSPGIRLGHLLLGNHCLNQSISAACVKMQFEDAFVCYGKRNDLFGVKEFCVLISDFQVFVSLSPKTSFPSWVSYIREQFIQITWKCFFGLTSR